jgi:hypothetical protein
MARGEAFFKLPDEEVVNLWRIDPPGRRAISEGDEVTIRELRQYGRNHLVKGGRRLRVRVVSIDRADALHACHVEILADLSPPPARQGELFD